MTPNYAPVEIAKPALGTPKGFFGYSHAFRTLGNLQSERVFVERQSNKHDRAARTIDSIDAHRQE